MQLIRNYRTIIGLLLGLIIVTVILIFPESKSNLFFGISGAITVFSIVFLYYKKWLLFIAVSAIPISTGAIFPGTGMSVSLPSELLVGLMAIYVVFQLGRNKIEASILRHPVTIILFIDLIWMLVTTIMSSAPDISLKRFLMRSVFLLVFYLVTASFAKGSIINVLKLFLLYLFGLIPVMYFTFIKHMHYDFDLKTVFEICAPYYTDHTIYAACLAFVIPICLVVLWNSRIFKLSILFKTILILIFVFLVSQEVLALSRAALISLAAAFVFYLFLKTKWKSYVLFSILAVALIVVVSYQAEIYTNVASTEAVSNDGDVANHFSSVTNVKTDASNLERINRWVCAVEMFKMRPLTGYGPGTYQFEYGQFQTSEFKTYISTNHGDRGNAHSEYLTYLSESGLPGMLLFVCLVLYTVHLGIKNYHVTSDPKEKVILLGILLGLITFYVHGLVNSFMDQDKMAFLVYASVAAIVLFDLKNKKLEKAAQ
ncbi:MAG: putative inorganic carbon (HCO3(-)) transporter [Parvicellaceae bacterium]